MTSVSLEIRVEIREFLDQITMSTTYQNLWDTSEAILPANFITWGAYIKIAWGGISRNGGWSIVRMKGERTVMEEEG